jgi:transposase
MSIVALGMVMGLCLLVYTIAQRFLRKQLEKLRTFLPNQLGKPTKRLTASDNKSFILLRFNPLIKPRHFFFLLKITN